MSIIIQTGHSSSHANKLMQMLYERGLSKPVKSHTHGLSTNDIADKLAKVLSKNESAINTKIVDNLIIDLLIANLDQDDWGWSDEKNIYALPYWQQSDDGIRFILVFDSPKLLLQSLLDQAATPELVEAAIHEWVDYHERLLVFFETYSSHCLLMEGDLAINNLTSLKDHIQTIGTNLKLENNWQLPGGIISQAEICTINPMYNMVMNEIFKQYPNCLVLYELLIEKSSVCLKNKNLSATNNLVALIQSLNLFNEQEEFKKILIENELLQQKLLVLMSEKEVLEQQLSQNLLLEQSKSGINNEQQAQIEHYKQENGLLIGQLYQVQEELEKYYLQHKNAIEQLKLVESKKQQLQDQLNAKVKLENELNALKEAKQKVEQTVNEQKKKIDEFTQQKQKLESELADLTEAKQESDKQANTLMANKKILEGELANLKGIKQKSDNLVKENQKLESELETLKEVRQQIDEQAIKASSSIQQENEFLISQLHQVQEELEWYYLENQKLKSESSRELPKPLYYGAADRLKEDLPYRLGATMVSHSKSAKDLAVLPLALVKEYREFQKYQPIDLPAIDEYQDADEAEKIKKHLSYRLGKTLVDGVKSKKVEKLLGLPIDLSKEVIEFKSNN